MMKLLGLPLLLVGAWAKVIEATDEDFENCTEGIPSIVDLYATWCGHCTTFSPVFDELAAAYEHLPDRIRFVKIDGDNNRKASRKFKVEYFPTIKFVNEDGHMKEIDDRDIRSIKKFIKDKLGITPDTPATKVEEDAEQSVIKEEDVIEEAVKDEAIKEAKQESTDDGVEKVEKAGRKSSFVVELVDDNFEDAVLGKNALIAFTTEWCMHCRKLAPEWEELAKLYARDDDLVIANVDCTNVELTYSLTEVFEVDAFPKIMFFHADFEKRQPVEYEGGRTVESFVEFLRKEKASHRTISGMLDSMAGLIPGLDFTASDLLEKVKDSPYADIYEKVVTKAKMDKSYLEKEAKRLAKILEGSLSGADKDAFTIKLNIIRALSDAGNKVKDEL